MGLAKKIFRDPLILFLGIGALLFAGESIFARDAKPRIYVDQQTVSFLYEQRAELLGRELSGPEKQDTIQSFVDDEILYAEAYDRGLDRGDSRIRSGLIRKMRDLIIGPPGTPSDEELRDFHREYAEIYTAPVSLWLEQVYYVESNYVLDGIVAKLQSGEVLAPTGNPAEAVVQAMPQYTEQDIVAAFGTDVANRILEIEDGDWHGPFMSKFGAHFLRITRRTASRLVPYEEACPI